MKGQTEIWKSHPEYTGIEVSSFGRVRSAKGHCYKNQQDKNGYMTINFNANGKYVNKYVHRLVAQTFIANPKNFPEVNHKDCNRANNNVSNLEWCSRSYNMQYKEKYGISSAEALGHSMFAINLSTLEVSHFRSQSEASSELGVSQPSISAVIKGKLKQAGGYWFMNDEKKDTDAIKLKLQEIGKTGSKVKFVSKIISE